MDELIEIAGGQPVFPELRQQHDARGRIVQPGAVAAANPDVIIASWCGRKVRKETIREREGWQAIGAVRDDHIYEVKSTYILQPGPAALTEGVRQLHAILARVAGCETARGLAPDEPADPDLARQKGKRGRCTQAPKMTPDQSAFSSAPRGSTY